MNTEISNKLLLCYIDGLDFSRINEIYTPFIFNIIKSHPWVRITSPPSADALPTFLTGTYPSEHGMFGVKLKSNTTRSIITKIIDQLPDIVTTTTQCLFQMLTGSYDLPAIPPKRRRHFEILRTQQDRRYKKTYNLLQIGGKKSFLGVVGRGGCRYLYSRTSSPAKKLIKRIGSGNYTLEFVQVYSFDLLQRWNLDKVEETRKIYQCADNFIKVLYEKCQLHNITLLLFSDHGYDRIKGYINLIGELKKLDLSEEEYAYFIELSMARFWFYTERARNKIINMLKEIKNTIFIPSQDLHKFNISFHDQQYGEAFIMSCPDYVFFPHDFHHPMANFYLGIIDPKQRPRLYDPKHRGDHTILPYFESAKGFMILFDKDYKTAKQEIDLIDVAPSLLKILGYKKPEHMKGSEVFIAR